MTTIGTADGRSTDLPFVSIIVPVLDRADMIGDLLDSLVAQTYPPDRHEIVVVDNGSTDDTPRVVERYPVRLEQETRRRSSYAARNRGIEVTRGDILAFTDSDCIASPEWLAALVEGADDPAWGAFTGEVVAFPASTRPERFLATRRVEQHAMALRHPYLPCATTSNVAYRRAVIEAIGPFDADLRSGGDVDLAWRMQERTPYQIAYRPRAIIAHRNRRTVGAMWRQSELYGEGIAALERRHPIFHRDHSARAGSPAWRNALYQFKRLPAVARMTWRRGARGTDAVAFVFYDVLLQLAFNRGVRRGRRTKA